MMIHYLTFMILGVLIGRELGDFLVKGTIHIINREYGKGIAYTLLVYVIFGLQLYSFSDNINTIVVFLIFIVFINALGYVAIKNKIKGVE